jgi:predicted RNA methylase
LVDDGGLLRAAIVEPIGALDNSREPFLPAEHFDGPRNGYTFKQDRLGLGYYRDDYAGPPAWVVAEDEEAEPPPERCQTCALKGVRVNSYYQGKVGQCYCCGLPWDHDVAGPEPEPEPEPVDAAAVRALRSYLQDVSELQGPNWQINALGDRHLQHTFVKAIEELHASQTEPTHWLHLGTGTCVPLMKTLSLCGSTGDVLSGDLRSLLDRIGLSHCYPMFADEELTDVTKLCKMLSRLDELRDALREIGVVKIGQRERIITALKEHSMRDKPPDITVTAVTGHDAAYIFSAAHRILSHNDLRSAVHLIHRRVEAVKYSPTLDLGLSEARRGSAIEEARRANLAKHAGVCVVDPELLDEGLIGKRVLHHIAHAKRELLSASVTIVPAAASVHAMMVQISCPRDSAVGFDLSKLDRYRWSPCYEKFVWKDQPAGTCKQLSEATEILHFDWQTMSADELTHGGNSQCQMTPLEDGSVNAILFWFELHMTGGGQPAKICNGPDSDCTAWGQALQWLTPAVAVQAHKTMELKVDHSSTRIRFELSSPPPEQVPDPEPSACGDESDPSFSWQKAAYRAQRTDDGAEDEVFVQLHEDGLLFFQCTAPHIFLEKITLQELSAWTWTEDSEGDTYLILTMRVDKKKIGLEISTAASICKYLSQAHQWNDMKERGLVSDEDGPPMEGGPKTPPDTENDATDSTGPDGMDADVADGTLQGTLSRWHFDMVADTERNKAYDSAIRRQVAKVIAKRKREETQAWYADPTKAALAPDVKGRLVEVLDIGCGSGLLAMMTARAAADLGEGAAVRVTGVDTSENLINTAAEIVTSNGYGSHMTLVNKDSRMLTVGEPRGGKTPELKRRADILVLELFDYGLLGEGLLPILHHAFSVLLKEDAVVVPAIARMYCCIVENRSDVCEGFNVELWNTYRYSTTYIGQDIASEAAAGRVKELSEPVKLFEFDLSKYVQPVETTREERVAALELCKAEAHADFDPEAADPDNRWGALQSTIAQEAMHLGDPAFIDGELVEAFMHYTKGTGMEPLNEPMKARLTAAKRALGFPLPESMHVDIPVTQTGVLNAVVFWFELQMEKTEIPISTSASDEESSPSAATQQEEECVPFTLSTAPSQTRRGTHWLQACQFIEEINVQQGETIPLIARHDGTSETKFAVDRANVSAQAGSVNYVPTPMAMAVIAVALPYIIF